MDTTNNARKRAVAVRTPVATPASVIAAGQVTTRAMSRLLRMQGVATTTTTKPVMGPRRGTRPREASSMGLPTSTLVAPAAGALLAAASSAGRAPMVMGAAATSAGALAPKRGGLRRPFPAAGTPAACRQPASGTSGVLPRRAGAALAVGLRQPTASRPSHGKGPAPISAVRAASVTRGLRRGALARPKPAVVQRRAA